MITQTIVSKFLKRFDKIESGSLSITLPDQSHYVFEGQTKEPRVHLNIKAWSVFNNILYKGDVGFAEDYKNGKWETDNLIGLNEMGLKNRSVFRELVLGSGFFRAVSKLKYMLRMNTIKGSKENIHAHYDLGNPFYKLWLDQTMTYSAAIFKEGSESLMDAQYNKYDRIIDCLEQDSGNLLEVGCGWGGFAERAHAKGDFGIKGITLSEEQHKYAGDRLGQGTNIALEDYRNQSGMYDHIVSIEMFEAVGEQFWKTYFEKMASLLKTKGKAVIQTITMNEQDFDQYRKGSDFIRSYIFPGGMLPSISRFQEEANKAGLKSGNVFTFGQDYAKTLNQWLETFETKTKELQTLGFDEKFIRLWRLYLAACIAGFKANHTDVMQIELVKA